MGPKSRVETRYLDDPNLKPADLVKKLMYFFNSPTCGGTTIDDAGNLYEADANEKGILKVMPAGQSSVLVQGPCLIWPDTIRTDHANMWIQVPQMNRVVGFQKDA